MRTELDKMVR